MPSRNYLFNQIDAYSVQQKLRQQMQAEIANFESNRLLNSHVEDLVKYFSEKNKIEVPELLEEEMVIDQKEAQRDVSVTLNVVSIMAIMTAQSWPTE